MNKTLITKDAKGKIRVAEINCELLDSGIYLITRITYQYGGKRTNQPSIEITEGKAKRTIKEQADYPFNFYVKPDGTAAKNISISNDIIKRTFPRRFIKRRRK